jgi:hypothetical protein
MRKQKIEDIYKRMSSRQERFLAMWNDSLTTRMEMAQEFGVTADMVTAYGQHIGLPRRKSGYRTGRFQREFDPTPEEIRQRAADIREGRNGHPGWSAEDEAARRVVKSSGARGFLCIHGELNDPVFSEGNVPSYMEAELTSEREVHAQRRRWREEATA